MNTTADRIKFECEFIKEEFPTDIRYLKISKFRPIISRAISVEDLIRCQLDMEFADIDTAPIETEFICKLAILLVMWKAYKETGTLEPEAMCRVIDAVRDLLIEKNKSYGDSALHPIKIFANAEAELLIRVRIDDKLNRIINNPEAFGEDVVMDLLGYFILFMIALDEKYQ